MCNFFTSSNLGDKAMNGMIAFVSFFCTLIISITGKTKMDYVIFKVIIIMMKE